MLAGNVTPIDLFEFVLQQTYYYSRKSGRRDPGSPVAIVILLLRLSDPEMFVGKLSKWWPLACLLVCSFPQFEHVYAYLTSTSCFVDHYCSLAD